ncbi:MAG: hypothetical protein IJP13_04625, partial [Lachnospiraceae bacterium]|nr:hypothetical protein [Lachnospiraceae bacterium]
CLLGVLAVTLCLSACSSDNSDVDNFLNEYENINLNISKEWDGINYHNNTSSCYGESTQGYYYYDSAKDTMMYISKEACKAIPLCTKVECIHGTELEKEFNTYGKYITDCDAIYSCNSGIQVYNGSLYADERPENELEGLAIIKAEMDGTNKQEVFHNLNVRIEEEDTLLEKTGEVFMYSTDWVIVEDEIYVVTEAHVKDNEKILGRVYVDIYDLSTGERVKELFYKEYEADDLIPVHLYVAADAVYVGLRIYIEQGEEMLGSSILLEIDKEAGTFKEVTLGQDSSYIGYNYFNDKLIFGKQGGDIYLLDVDGDEQLCIKLDEREKEVGMFFSKKGEYIILNPREAVKLEDGSMGYYSKIYNSEYKYLDTIYFTENFRPSIGNGDKIIYQGDDSEKYYYIDTNQIGTGNIELKEIEMPKVKKDNNASEE